MLRNNPGPVGMPPAFDRVAYERGRDAASIPIRLAMIRSTRSEVPKRTLNFEDQDRLVCHYICLAAAYIVAQSGDEGRDALIEAEKELEELESILAQFFRGMAVNRSLVLRAVIYYNFSVLLFENNHFEVGQEFLSKSRALLEDVSEPRDRSSALYVTTEEVLTALEVVAGNTNGK